MAVGARPFLIAYNINLGSPDRDLAVRIARRIRESGGGLPRLQANGFFIEELDRAQVSMNVLDFRVTPLWRIWETVRAEAAEDGVELAESELIGLAPVAHSSTSRTTSRRRPTRRSSSGWPRPRASSGCATSARCRRSSCGSRPPRPRQTDGQLDVTGAGWAGDPA